MRTWLMVVALALGLMCQSLPAAAQAVRAPTAPAGTQMDLRPVAIGLGAIAGVVAFNVLVLGIEAVPGGSLVYGAGAAVPAEMSVAISRVYATTSAVIGGLVAYYASAPR